MYGMFNFMSMADNYEERKVDNTKFEKTEIDTCSVTDSNQDYETGIKDPRYNDGDWIIVEMYDTKEEAQTGHNKWVETMRNNPPSELKDMSTCEWA